MPRPIKNLTNMEIDEISLVDKSANQHAMITIAKRAPEEDQMPQLYNEDGQLLDENNLEDGQVVYDDDGQAWQFSLEEEAAEEREPEPVGKSAFFDSKSQPASASDFSKSVMEELSKAFTDEDRDKVFAKALGRIDEMDTKYSQMEQIAKAERDLRLTREYISKADEYNLPIDSDELGPVLYRMAESMSYDDCAVIAKCLETAGTILYEEVGFQGGGDNADIYSQVTAHATEEIGKAAGAADVNAVFDANPDAYDQYLADQRGL